MKAQQMDRGMQPQTVQGMVVAQPQVISVQAYMVDGQQVMVQQQGGQQMAMMVAPPPGGPQHAQQYGYSGSGGGQVQHYGGPGGGMVVRQGPQGVLPSPCCGKDTVERPGYGYAPNPKIHGCYYSNRNDPRPCVSGVDGCGCSRTEANIATPMGRLLCGFEACCIFHCVCCSGAR